MHNSCHHRYGVCLWYDYSVAIVCIARSSCAVPNTLQVKMFHWLVQDRVAFMEQTPNITRLFHARMVGVSAILAATDAFLVGYVGQDCGLNNS